MVLHRLPPASENDRFEDSLFFAKSASYTAGLHRAPFWPANCNGEEALKKELDDDEPVKGREGSKDPERRFLLDADLGVVDATICIGA